LILKENQMLDAPKNNREKGSQKPKRKYLIPRALEAIADEVWSNPPIFPGVGGFIAVGDLFSLGETSALCIEASIPKGCTNVGDDR
jgi:hypothetical protein